MLWPDTEANLPTKTISRTLYLCNIWPLKILMYFLQNSEESKGLQTL